MSSIEKAFWIFGLAAYVAAMLFFTVWGMGGGWALCVGISMMGALATACAMAEGLSKL